MVAMATPRATTTVLTTTATTGCLLDFGLVAEKPGLKVTKGVLLMTKYFGMVALVATLFASVADAHHQLKAGGPAPGSVVKVSPKALRIQFNEGVVLGFSRIEVTNAAGEKQPVGEATLGPKDRKQLIAPLKA